MNWNSLSRDAKGIIEWIEDPYSGRRMELEIILGTYFEPVSLYGTKPTKIMVTNEVYQEVLKFVSEDEDLEYKQTSDGMVFKIKESSKLKLH